MLPLGLMETKRRTKSLRYFKHVNTEEIYLKRVTQCYTKGEIKKGKLYDLKPNRKGTPTVRPSKVHH